jgi:hypothetical protein
MKRYSGQRYSFGLMDSLLAEVAEVPQAALHLDVEAIAKAYEVVQPIAARLGIETPKPRLAGLSYNHVSTLGAKVTISYEAREPFVTPCIRCPKDIDNLRNPTITLRLASCRIAWRCSPDSSSAAPMPTSA